MEIKVWVMQTNLYEITEKPSYEHSSYPLWLSHFRLPTVNYAFYVDSQTF